MSMSGPFEDEAISIEYVAGVFDGAGSILLAIREKKSVGVGFEVSPLVRITTPCDAQAGLLDEFALQHGLRHQFRETEAGNRRWQLQAVEDVKNFLDLVMPYLLKEYERAEIMRNEVIPLLEDDEHHKKRGMIRIARLADELNETRQRQRDRKFTEEYFRELWEDDLY